jgi:hypothetical protein
MRGCVYQVVRTCSDDSYSAALVSTLLQNPQQHPYHAACPGARSWWVQSK